MSSPFIAWFGSKWIPWESSNFRPSVGHRQVGGKLVKFVAVQPNGPFGGSYIDPELAHPPAAV
jgi:hypothetical protein